MRHILWGLLAGLGLSFTTASQSRACLPPPELKDRVMLRGVLRPHVEPPTGPAFLRRWAPAPIEPKWPVPVWKLEAEDRTWYLHIGDPKLAALAARLNGKQVDLIGLEFFWEVYRTPRPDARGRTPAIADQLLFTVPGLSVREMHAVPQSITGTLTPFRPSARESRLASSRNG